MWWKQRQTGPDAVEPTGATSPEPIAQIHPQTIVEVAKALSTSRPLLRFVLIGTPNRTGSAQSSTGQGELWSPAAQYAAETVTKRITGPLRHTVPWIRYFR